MSFFESITKKSKLKAAIKQTTEARNSEGSEADQLFKAVYHDYAEVVANEPLVAEALYNWGFALLHQARTKLGDQAANLYQDAIAKFSFCLTIEPAYLGAAIDGGVAYMELARIKAVATNDNLYGCAKNYFEKANAIQAGSASYNLACIHGLRGDKEACLTALEIAKGKGSLPIPADILGDPDLATVKDQGWFTAFMETLNEESEAVAEVIAAVSKDTTSNEKSKAVEDSAAAEAVVAADVQEIEKAADEMAGDVVSATEAEAVAEHKAEANKDAPVSEKTEVVAERVKSPYAASGIVNNYPK